MPHLYDIKHLQRSDKTRVRSLDEALDFVRETYPRAYLEGSTKRMYSFWIPETQKPLLVALARGIRSSDDWWVWFDEDDDEMRNARTENPPHPKKSKASA